VTVTIKGLDALKRRLKAPGLDHAVADTLRLQAETIAAGAAREAPGRLGETVEMIEERHGDRSAFAVGTARRAGRYLEYGTVHRPATPWLWPVLAARLPRIKQDLRNTLRASFGTRRGEV